MGSKQGVIAPGGTQVLAEPPRSNFTAGSVVSEASVDVDVEEVEVEPEVELDVESVSLPVPFPSPTSTAGPQPSANPRATALDKRTLISELDTRSI